MASLGRRSSLMERLRQLRTSNTTSSPTVTGGSMASPAHRDAEAKEKLKPALKPRSKSKYHDEALDLEQVNSKLEAIALERSQSQEIEDVENSDLEDEQAAHLTSKSREKLDEGYYDSTMDGAANNTSTGANNDYFTTRASQEKRAASAKSKGTPSIVITPPDDDPADSSTDLTEFQLFLQQAEVDEEIRKKQGHISISPKSKPPPPLNHFYSNNVGTSSSLPTKLAEIPERNDDNIPAGAAKHRAIESVLTTSDARTSMSASSDNSNDFAAATDSILPAAPARVNTLNELGGRNDLGRHVSFSEPAEKVKKAVSNNSAYRPGRGLDSPSPEFIRRKKRSFRDVFRSCFRLA